MNVLSVIDKKLSDISINIPTDHRCSPSIDSTPTILIRTEQGKISKIELIKNKNVSGVNLENFGDFGDSGKAEPTSLLKQGYHSNPSDPLTVNRGADIYYPDYDDILRYDGPGCYENRSNNEIRKVQLQVADKPIVQKCEGGLNIAKVNSVRKLTLTADGEIVDQNVDFYIPETYLGVSGQRGAMITGYPSFENKSHDQGEPADIDQIGSIPVNNYRGEPVPIGSFFMQ
jgi:hypothetical protein